MDAHLSTKIAEGRVFMQIVESNRFESFSASAAARRFEALYDMSATKTIVANHG